MSTEAVEHRSGRVSVADIEQRVSAAVFGHPLITNVLRGHVVEAIVATALEPEWNWCGADYASWDFERADGLRLEVKQSANRQTWVGSSSPRASFDVAVRTGRWEGAEWIEESGRSAHIYVFAHHHVSDAAADHRDPGQWRFHVLPASALPAVKRLALGSVQRLAASCSYDHLAEVVAEVAGTVRSAEVSR